MAETEGFEPSVPLRGLHLSRVELAGPGLGPRNGAVPRDCAESSHHQAYSVLDQAARAALYPHHQRDDRDHRHPRGPLGDPRTGMVLLLQPTGMTGTKAANGTRSRDRSYARNRSM